jgi:hypothetical protein
LKEAEEGGLRIAPVVGVYLPLNSINPEITKRAASIALNIVPPSIFLHDLELTIGDCHSIPALRVRTVVRAVGKGNEECIVLDLLEWSPYTHLLIK